MTTLHDGNLMPLRLTGFNYPNHPENNVKYYQKVLHNVRENIDPSNQIVGEYMCQGKMPMAMRERYVKMKEDPNHKPNLDMLIENFDRALSHPDKTDLEKLQKSVLR